MIAKPHLPMPRTLEEIDAAWLSAALSVKIPGARVNTFKIVDMIRGTSTKLRLSLELNEVAKQAGVPQTVIVKGGFEDHSDNMHYMYEREVRGFRDIWPDLRLPSPEPYFADYDPEQRHGIIIMEDLVARGVSFCEPLKPQSHEQVAQRLTELARYHAKSWGSSDFQLGGKWDWVESHLNALLTFIDENIDDAFWARFLALPRGAVISSYFHDRHWANDAMVKVKALCESLPQALIHGDTHLGNLYIDFDGTPGFYDSLAGRAPGMMEISYHIVCALDVIDRPRWEGSLVQHYLDELRRNGVSPPSFDEAMYQYAIFLAFGYYIFLVNEPFFQTETVNTLYAARFNAAMIDHRTMELLNSIP